ncbi:MAG TPA: DUF547 domain-containing protein [Methylomirabilota bacterium]|nr:DUF547 domain-containing protein [Methylomirabilota bacterium]
MGRFVLNEPAAVGAGNPAGELGETLQRRLLGLLAAFSAADGRVDYARLRGSEDWAAAVRCARRLEGVDLGALTEHRQRLAFWINVYNALVLHGVIALGVRRSVREVRNFFGRVSYRIGGYCFSADEIEHGILRGNRRRLFLPLRCFSRRDPRRAFAVEPMDPRIHFALTCAARSCPPAGVYRAATVDEQLDLAARGFLNEEVALDGRGCVCCSRLLKWYRGDFEAAGGLQAFLLRYLDDGAVREAVAHRSEPCQVYRPYHWTLQHEPIE